MDVVVGKNKTLRHRCNELALSYDDGCELVAWAYDEGFAIRLTEQ